MKSSRIPLQEAKFRLLRTQDAQEILEWRNHPEIFMFTSSGKPISPENHNKWMETRLTKLSISPIYILENNLTLGMFRVDSIYSNSTAREISILVNPNSLGVGIGSHMMDLYFNDYVSDSRDKYFARIHKDNIKSQRFFEKHKFFKLNKVDQFLLFQRKVSDG